MKLGVTVLGLIACLTVCAAEDRFAVFSSSKAFVAEFAHDGQRFEFTLRKVQGASTQPLWKGAFPSDSFARYQVHILEAPPAVVIQAESPDGDDSPALWFFRDGKPLRDWTMRAILQLLPPESTPSPSGSPATADRAGLADLLKGLESVNREFQPPAGLAGLWNAEGAMGRLEQVQGKWLFCLWLGFRDAWLAWDPLTGGAVPLAESIQEDQNRSARDWARRQVEIQKQNVEINDSDTASAFLKIPHPGSISYESDRMMEDTKLAYKFLARRKNPADRNVIERLLSAEASVHSSGGVETDA